MSGADADGADIRPTLLAIALLALYGGFFLVEPVRDFFELTLLPLADVALIGGLAIVWALLVMLMWRTRLVERTRNRIYRSKAPPRLEARGGASASATLARTARAVGRDRSRLRSRFREWRSGWS